MELFLPSVLVIMFSALVFMLILPKLSPLIIVIVSAVLLTASTYQHFQLFWHEYRESSWQTSLKIFAPGIIIAAVFLYIFVIGGSFLTGKSNASMPPMELPSASTATNPLTSALNSSMSAVSNAASTVTGAVSGAASAVTNSLGLSSANQSRNNNNSRSANKGPTTSTLAII
jgi:hypothetical protein